MAHVTVDRDALLETLKRVLPAVPAKSTLPCLMGVLFVAGGRGDDSWIEITGSSLDLTIKARVAGEVEKPIDTIIPARLLRDLLKELPSGGVQISATLGERLRFVSGKGEFDVEGMDSAQWPATPQIDYAEAHRLTARDLQALTTRTAYAISDDENRPQLAGALVELRPGSIRFTATNGHILARSDLPVEGTVGASNYTVPKGALTALFKVAAPHEEVRVAEEGLHLGFETDSVELVTRLVDGTYPPVDQVIPTQNDKRVTVSRERLVAMLRRVAVLAGESGGVMLTVSPNLVRVSTDGDLFGGGREELVIGYEGPTFEIGFNADYLLSILDEMPTDDVLITFREPNTAALISPVDWRHPGTYFALAMPRRLAGRTDVVATAAGKA